ncbi:hypothetical protein BLNAU_23146 [Blattamonas nauphoetae]|uniref:Uncharacterized protein n=1 Tax=Blattamonas nauphoetae TaxID=2049346 RepID=A0ABQ9WR33_9EUKA|nr:hypothetical protein BLNAU_23146 [Blattamonas nauphoetae]
MSHSTSSESHRISTSSSKDDEDEEENRPSLLFLLALLRLNHSETRSPRPIAPSSPSFETHIRVGRRTDTALPHPARHTTVSFPIRVAAAVCVQPVSSEGVRSRRRQNGEFSATLDTPPEGGEETRRAEERECEGDSGRSVRASAESDRNRA